jgi:hypothetical protein
MDRRQGIPFDENVFYCTAPLTTNSHLAFLGRLEDLALGRLSPGRLGRRPILGPASGDINDSLAELVGVAGALAVLGRQMKNLGVWRAREFGHGANERVHLVRAFLGHGPIMRPIPQGRYPRSRPALFKLTHYRLLGSVSV